MGEVIDLKPRHRTSTERYRVETDTGHVIVSSAASAVDIAKSNACVTSIERLQ